MSLYLSRCGSTKKYSHPCFSSSKCVWSNIRCVDCPCAHTRVMTKHSKYSRLIGHEHRARIARFEPGRSFSRALCLFSHLFKVTILLDFWLAILTLAFTHWQLEWERKRKTRELLFAYTHTLRIREKKEKRKNWKNCICTVRHFFFQFCWLVWGVDEC